MKYFYLVVVLLSLNSCYSLKNVSISPDLQSFYINKFENKALNSPPIITQIFEETLLNKIRNESRLKYQEIDPHVEFSGAIVGYNVLSVAPEPNETTAFNRLQITVQVSYANSLDEKDKWQQNFSFFENYRSDVNLIDVQDNLISLIYDQIVEDIFNKAFTNW
jgi:hypothetical protein